MSDLMKTGDSPATSPRCKAKAKGTGERCRRAPVPGAEVCRVHGGAAAQVQAKAAERVLEARVAGEVSKRGWVPLTDPLGAFADLIGEVWAFKELCREKLADLYRWDYQDEKGAEDLKPLVAVYERALDRAGKQLLDMLRLGLDAQALGAAKERPSREQAEALQRVIDGLLAGLDLSPEQHQKVPAALAAAIKMEGLL